MSEDLSTDLFDKEVLEKEKETETAEPDMTMPAYGSSEWHDYVMSKFHDSEMYNGNPLTTGLRRVAEELLGDILVSRPVQVSASNDPNGPGRATVSFEVVIDWMNSGQLRTYGDVADCWHGNSDDLFCAHPAATASTKAEGRCLRKALKVRCVAAEEIPRNKDVVAIVRQSIASKPTTGEWNEEDPISVPQINFIDGKCKQLNINVIEFINMGEKTYDKIGGVSKKTASKMLGILNEYQTKSKPTPDSIVGYNSNWRDT
jgi:hypothetical protein